MRNSKVLWQALPRPLRAAALELLGRLSAKTKANGPIVATLLIYAVLWTISATVRNLGLSLHGDMVEEFAVSQSLGLGYGKHPPLINWIVAGWFAFMPSEPWAFYFLSCLNAALGMWAVWLAAGRIVDTRRQILAVALLGLLPIFTFHAATFNHNTLLLSLWPLVALSFLVSIERRNGGWSVLFGVTCALAMLAKYYSFWIITACALAALLHPNWRAYFLSLGPYLAAATFLAIISPHAAWLAEVDFVTVTRLREAFGQPMHTVAANTLFYASAFVAYLAPALLAIWICLQPSAQSILRGWPPMRRVIACIVCIPIFAPLMLYPFAALSANVPWMYPALFFVPLLILSAPALFVSRRAVAGVLVGMTSFAGLCVVLSPLLMIVNFHTANWERTQPIAAFAEIATDVWRGHTGRPLKLLSPRSYEGWSISFYSKDHPTVDFNTTSKFLEEQKDERYLGVCRLDDMICNDRLAQRNYLGEQIVVSVLADFLWIKRPPVDYVLYLEPAMQTANSVLYTKLRRWPLKSTLARSSSVSCKSNS